MSLLTQASLVLTPNAYKTGKLYSVIPSNGNGDFTVTRATTATRVNSAGLVQLVPYNLLTWSEMFSDASWNKIGSTITANTTTAPNGTLTADTFSGDGIIGNHQVTQSTSYAIGLSYTYSLYAKKGTNNFIQFTSSFSAFGSNSYANFDLNNGVLGTVGSTATATITSVGDGWYRCTMTSTATATTTGTIANTLITSATSPRAEANTLSTSLFIWGAQFVEGTSALTYQPTTTRLNIPRLDYSLGSCPNILLEPQRTNLLLNSVFSGTGSLPTSWGFSFNTGTSAPATSTYTNIGQAYTFTTSTTRQVIFQTLIAIIGNNYSASVKVESVSGSISVASVVFFSGTGTQTFYRNGQLINSTDNVIAGSTYTAILNASSITAQQVRIGNGCQNNTTGTVVLSMPQLELGAYPTSYIPTTSASVTRNADVISRNNIFTNGLVTASGGTWFVDIRNNRFLTRDAGSVGIALADSNTGGVNSFSLRSLSQRINVAKYIAGAPTSLFATTTDTAKIAIKWNGTTADVFVNGVKVVTETAFTTTALEFLTNTATQDVPKYINQMALFPTPLTDTQCTQLTTL